MARRLFRVALAWMLATVLLTAKNSDAAIVTFGGLPGSHSDPFLPYSEAGFTVTPITGRWLQGLDAHVLGNPLPDIYGDTNTASLEVTDSTAALFSFTSIDITSGTLNRTVEYTLQGLLAGATVFSITAEVPYPFVTINSPSAALIDTLRLSMVRLTAEGYEVDNIRLNEPIVPEPSSAILLAGLIAIFGFTESSRRNFHLLTMSGCEK